MAPEQVRGKTVDNHSDIWAFGAVLFEMLTGKCAFGDEDVSLTLSNVLHGEPDFNSLPSTTPARVRQLLSVCLRKDPKQRAGDFRDVRLALEGAFETTAAQPVVPVRRERLAWGIALGVAAVVILALAISTTLPVSEAPPPVTRGTLTRVSATGGAVDKVTTFSPGQVARLAPLTLLQNWNTERKK